MKRDPLMLASFISTMWRERNPLLLIALALQQKIATLMNLRKNMRASEKRIQQLEARTEQIKSAMAEQDPYPQGDKLNTWR